MVTAEISKEQCCYFCVGTSAVTVGYHIVDHSNLAVYAASQINLGLR